MAMCFKKFQESFPKIGVVQGKRAILFKSWQKERAQDLTSLEDCASEDPCARHAEDFFQRRSSLKILSRRARQERVKVDMDNGA